MKTFVYIDGFNLYYGALRGSPFRWIDLLQMARLTLPKNDVRRVTLFTARVSPLPHDRDAPNRQKAYFKALGTLPPDEFRIVFGHFLVKPTVLPLAKPPATGSPLARVLRTEEKGSDVNLAVHLVNDAAKGLFDAAVVFSADSDLCEAIRIARDDYGKTVGVVIPQTLENFRDKKKRRRCFELTKCASFAKDFIPPDAFKASLFPTVVKLVDGEEIHRPVGWDAPKPKPPTSPLPPLPIPAPVASLPPT